MSDCAKLNKDPDDPDCEHHWSAVGLREAVQMLAADNARLCDRLIAAEKVVEAARHAARIGANADLLKRALDAYDAGKPS